MAGFTFSLSSYTGTNFPVNMAIGYESSGINGNFVTPCSTMPCMAAHPVNGMTKVYIVLVLTEVVLPNAAHSCWRSVLPAAPA